MLANARCRSVASTEKFECCTGSRESRSSGPVLDADFPVFSTEPGCSRMGIMQMRNHDVHTFEEES
jgi:hypothetical protein